MSNADESKLRPANENPWYCLATLHGEHPEGKYVSYELAEKNRISWNRWIGSALGDEERAFVKKGGFREAELVPLSAEEKRAFCCAFAARTGRDGELPPELDPLQPYDFSLTHFDRGVSFDGFLFSQRADFGAAMFSGTVVSFHSATFLSGASFFQARFSDASSANFGYATFADEANFGSARFGEAFFRLATFSDSAYFGATFSGIASFESAQFLSENSFINAKFADRTTFVGTAFRTDVPDFRGATMHEATEWHGSIWPKPPHGRVDAQAQVYAYERLKQEMERLKKHEDEQRFFRKELRARRELARPWSGEWTMNFLYQVFSNYGDSIALPLIWLFGLFATGGAVFYLIHSTSPGAAILTMWHAAALSFGNIFPFVPITKELMSANPVIGWSRIEKAIAVAQTLLGTPLLFLLGLALRNRFRMK
jgi:hypothetical protein